METGVLHFFSSFLQLDTVSEHHSRSNSSRCVPWYGCNLLKTQLKSTKTALVQALKCVYSSVAGSLSVSAGTFQVLPGHHSARLQTAGRKKKSRPRERRLPPPASPARSPVCNWKEEERHTKRELCHRQTRSTQSLDSKWD